jgi:hypothetical protein
MRLCQYSPTGQCNSTGWKDCVKPCEIFIIKGDDNGTK